MKLRLFSIKTIWMKLRMYNHKEQYITKSTCLTFTAIGIRARRPGKPNYYIIPESDSQNQISEASYILCES